MTHSTGVEEVGSLAAAAEGKVKGKGKGKGAQLELLMDLLHHSFKQQQCEHLAQPGAAAFLTKHQHIHSLP